MTDMLAVGHIELKDDIGTIVFAPLLDITPWELAMCVSIFIKMSLNKTGLPMTWRATLEEHGLMKHFQPVDSTPGQA